MVNVNPQPGNKLFWMVKRDYSTDPPILVPSEKDTMTITVAGGDHLAVTSREIDGKTPDIVHSGGGGETRIETGRMKLRIAEGMMGVTLPRPLEKGIGEDFSGGFDSRNSVAFELTSDSETIKETLLTSSSNRFVFLREKKIFSGNNLGLEVSEFIDPNMVKTVDDLRQKYPDIKFQVGKTIFSEDKYYNEITANMAQLTNQWLSDKPEIDRYVPKIDFSTKAQASGGKEGGSGLKLELGERIFDPSTFMKTSVRDLENPIEILDHEFVHVTYDYIKNNEQAIIEGKLQNSAEYQSLSNKATITQEELDNKRDRLSQVEEDIGWASDLEKIRLENRKDELQSEIEHIRIELSETTRERDRLASDLAHQNTITQKYNEIIVAVSNDLYEDQEIRALLHQMNQLETGENKDFKKTLEELKILSESEEQRRAAFFSNIVHLRRHGGEAEALSKKFEQQITSKTGLNDYSFQSHPDNIYGLIFPEVPATYDELSILQAKKLRSLAQLEFDRVMNLNPPTWMQAEAEERYYQIMGGRDGSYCQKNPCGPCLIYTLTCQKE